MDRRDFLKGSTALAAATVSVVWSAARAAAPTTPSWRTFELIYRITPADGQKRAQLWVPLPHDAGDYQRALGVEWRSATATAAVYRDAVYSAPILHAAWPDSDIPHAIDITTRVVTRDRQVDPANPAGPTRPDAAEIALYLKPTPSMPTDGIVHKTAVAITEGARRPIDKARAIYDWIVDNTFRDPKVRGCGIGDIKFMLESGDLGGKCADINSLYVGLARAVGLPARECYGIRVADSMLSKSLGKSGDITKAQHCRAEVYVEGVGWLPVDPADVRKVALEEGLALDHPHVRTLRQQLFGTWEMNWVGFNYARDFRLEGQDGAAVGFLMYPYAETVAGPLDHLDPEGFRYQIAARAIAA
jgi:transglutaminase-like putative cysteine protease